MSAGRCCGITTCENDHAHHHHHRRLSMNPAAQALGRLGGAAKSPAKAEAARKNGRKGGWPKGRKRGPKAKT